MTTLISFRDFLHRFFLKDFFVPSFAKILFTSRLKERSGRRLGPHPPEQLKRHDHVRWIWKPHASSTTTTGTRLGWWSR